jgi:hypothetical protein
VASDAELWAAVPPAAAAASALLAAPANSWAGAGGAADAMPPARSCRVVDQLLWRPHKYNEKYAPQELALLHQVSVIFRTYHSEA